MGSEEYPGERTYSGWYPQLLYRPGSEIIPPEKSPDFQETGDEKGSDYWDALVNALPPAPDWTRSYLVPKP